MAPTWSDEAVWEGGDQLIDVHRVHLLPRQVVVLVLVQQGKYLKHSGKCWVNCLKVIIQVHQVVFSKRRQVNMPYNENCFLVLQQLFITKNAKEKQEIFRIYF